MRLLVAVALLILAVADAHHTPEHNLRGPRFSVGNLHVYDVELNVTSGIWGLDDQVSKSAFKAELNIYAKSAKEYFLRLKKVYTSGSVKAVDGPYGDVPMRKDSDLEDRLSAPIKFTMEKGEITSYTLSANENLESKKIKKSILRSLEMYIPDSAHEQIESSSTWKIPVVYNVSQESGWGEHTTHYMITVSPNVEYPYHSNIYNISRSDDFGRERYPSHTFHHNFESQGCPNVCKRHWENNEYGTGCPDGYEPYQSPVKTYVHHQHHLTLEGGVMTPEIIESREVHTAKMYDQDMNILINMNIRKIGFAKRTIEEPSGKMYTDLNNQEPEINELEIGEKCGYKGPREAMEVAKTLLKEISQIVVRGDLENTQSTIIGEKIILLKNALSRLGVTELETVAQDIWRLGNLKSAPEEEKVKRQIWMDMLPTIGTESSVTFIVEYIKKNLGQELMVWEAKEILEALPQNIHTPSEKNVRELYTLLPLSRIENRHLLHSAVYTCLGRVIGNICNGTETDNKNWLAQQTFQRRQRQPSHSSGVYGSEGCPEGLVSDIVKEITGKLRSTQTKGALVIYLETLALIGTPEVLPIISEYAYGTAQNIQGSSVSYHEFVRTTAVFTLHKMAPKYPEMVLETVKPLFFDGSEIPTIRNAAFGVLIRCQPSMEILQHVAVLTWKEKSNEVGSYVTSTLDTFGNSTLPCFLHVARRIRKVMPMVRRFDIGVHHAKNLLWTYFDDVRDFGVKGQMAYTPNNASIIPSAIYHALSYSTDSLTDNLIQGALHVQGLTQKYIIDYIDRNLFRMNPPEVIPPSKENEIFEEAKIAKRIPEELRLTIYRKMFYSSAFYYLDIQNIKTQTDILKKYLNAYLSGSSHMYSGHLVKVYLPSSFHTETIAKTLPYPVKFQMLQPVVLALKIKTLARNPSFDNLHLSIRPSVYLSKLFVHQIKNVGDCKDIGVYHEHKIAISYPLEVKFVAEGLKKITVSYKVPELPKRVLYYFTDSGTYAGKKSLRMLSSSENREPIRTLPSPFQYTPEVNIIGVPPVQIDVLTEEIDLVTEMIPKTPLEALHIAVKKMLNAGWRYKAVNITMRDDSSVWPRNTEVTFNIQYDRTHVTKENVRMNPQQQSPWSVSQTEDYSRDNEWVTEQPESDENEQSQWSTEDSQGSQSWFWNKNSDNEDTGDDWTQGLPSDIKTSTKASDFIERGRRGFFQLTKRPHIAHQLDIDIKTEPVRSNAYIRMEFNHTYTKSMYAVNIDAAIKGQKDRTPRKIEILHQMKFFGKPDEFRYDSHNDKHTAMFISALRTSSEVCDDPWKDVNVLASGIFYYEPLDTVLNNELQSKVSQEFFLPETHDECIQDVKDGHPLSENCVKALRERSIYNKLRMTVLWKKDLPRSVKTAARKLDTFFKHVYYNHMTVKDETNLKNVIHFHLTHIDKLTDKPVFDAIIKKPEETIMLRRVKTIGYALDDPLSSVHDVLGVDFMVLTNNTYPPTCVMMKKYVRTFDLRSYPIHLNRCNYVLSAHCSNYKNFAITTKVLSADDYTREIHIHVGSHTVILTPKNGKDYTISYNGQDHTVSEPIVFDENGAEIYVFTESFSSTHKHLYVVARKAGIKVVYDGQNVKVQVDPRYKGETCGLCSEFDGETVREFRGLDRCLYSHPYDFVNNAITNRGTCRKNPTYPFICDNDDSGSSMIWRRGSAHDEYEPTTKRNIVISKGSNTCFSVHAVPVCEEGSQVAETRTEPIGFHCLPKQDITARRMVSEAKRRSLGEIENKKVDYEEEIEVPKMCSE